MQQLLYINPKNNLFDNFDQEVNMGGGWRKYFRENSGKEVEDTKKNGGKEEDAETPLTEENYWIIYRTR